MTSIKSPKSNIYISKKCVLTEREIEYLSLASFGFKNKEIAKILSVTVGGVKKALEIIFSQEVQVPGMNQYLTLNISRNGMAYWTDKDGNSFSSYNGIEASSLVDDYMPELEQPHTK